MTGAGAVALSETPELSPVEVKEAIRPGANYCGGTPVRSSIPSAARSSNSSSMAKRIRILFAIGQMSGGGSQRQLIGILQRIDRARFEPQLYLVSPGGELLPEVPADVPIHVFDERHSSRLWLYPGHAHLAR